ncbi:MAG: flagellar assembly protein FliH [Asticcacaulis sp.]|nr:flagellar assembly protein FliH [Asticcacaulis sp.]
MQPEPVAHKKFDFGTVFGDGGKVVAQTPREKKFFTPEEVEAIRAKAYSEGEASAQVRAQMAQAAAVQALADAAHQGLNHVNELLQAYRHQTVQLALVCGQRIAAEALDRFPEAPVTAALEALAQEIETATRLVLLAPNPSEQLKAAAMEAATYAGLKGAFEVVWPDGRAEFNPQQVQEAIEKALGEALEADAFHQSRGQHGHE